MQKLFSSIACNLDSNLLLAALPLFASQKVQGIEWSFDTLFGFEKVPDWFEELLNVFSEEERLVGHGVFFSLFSGKWSEGQQTWLNHLREVSAKYQFDHVTEHFGFMTGENFHKGAPISIPFTKATLALGQDRLKRIAEAANCPVGLENLAFAYSIEEVQRHGEFLSKLLEPVNGFIILDLHNLYCQLHNFSVAYEELIPFYPLDRVREIHISGGSWVSSEVEAGTQIRRDTHDDAVPEEVFDLLKKTIPLCPNLKFVVLEQLGTGLKTEVQKQQFQKDFFRMEAIVRKFDASNNFQNTPFALPSLDVPNTPIEDQELLEQQQLLTDILENAVDYQQARDRLSSSVLANSSWEIESWEPKMLETVVKIARKWK